jgi:putative hemolysin
MKTLTLIGFGAFLSMTVACASASDPSTSKDGKQTSPVSGEEGKPDQPPPSPSAPDASPPPAPGCTALPATTGTANPAAVYCLALGYSADGEQCAFPDGTRCEQWAFYRGECGGAHSFCNQHGGTVSNKIEDMGTWMASYAVCTLPGGQQCHEDAFAHSCTCE